MSKTRAMNVMTDMAKRLVAVGLAMGVAVLGLLAGPWEVRAGDSGAWTDGKMPIALTSPHEHWNIQVGHGVLVQLQFYVRARMWRLAGEPVVYCDVAVGKKVIRRPTGAEWKGYSDADFAEAVRIYDVDMSLKVDGRDKSWVECDAGAISEQNVPNPRRFLQMPAEQRAEYFSFNTPRSPKWSKLVLPYGIRAYEKGTKSRHYAGEKQAKQIFDALETADARGKHVPLDGFSRGNGATLTRKNFSVDVEGHFDASFPEYGEAGKEIQKVEEALEAEKEAQERHREERRRELKAAGKDPFWDMPVETATTEQQSRLDALEAKLRRLNLRRESLGQRAKRWEKQQKRKQADIRLCLDRKCYDTRQKKAWDAKCDEMHQRVEKCIRQRCRSERLAFEKESDRVVWHQNGRPIACKDRKRCARLRREHRRCIPRVLPGCNSRWRPGYAHDGECRDAFSPFRTD